MINYQSNLFGFSCMFWFNFYPWFKFYFSLFWVWLLPPQEALQNSRAYKGKYLQLKYTVIQSI